MGKMVNLTKSEQNDIKYHLFYSVSFIQTVFNIFLTQISYRISELQGFIVFVVYSWNYFPFFVELL